MLIPLPMMQLKPGRSKSFVFPEVHPSMRDLGPGNKEIKFLGCASSGDAALMKMTSSEWPQMQAVLSKGPHLLQCLAGFIPTGGFCCSWGLSEHVWLGINSVEGRDCA